ncbi:MAG TPA: rhamnogalacturonan lyase [Fibrobacteria bacterium]|nr:rhamnogalacturonan lyase [Fibrobacteria bacterium]HOX50008.1 rhamnogalacturonan lyase [Fibrobacteria bacterium]
MKRSFVVPASLLLALACGGQAATRDMENLDRGVVAVKTASGVFVGWRVLGTDPANLAFNVYRGATKVNASPITGATNLVDEAGTASSIYSVRPVQDGVEQTVGGEAAVWASQTLKIALDRPAGGTLEGSAYTYSPSDIAVGDLDGDGRWDLVVKWDPSNAKDNSQAGMTGNVFLDAYTLQGRKLWRIDLGVNIRAGAHYTQMLVGDYDSDGKAEVACKTAPGTRDASNAFLSKGPAASDDDSKDYRNSAGRVNAGPEYLTIFEGATGKEMATVVYVPRRHPTAPDNPTAAQLKAIWGDDYGGRFDRFLATNAYLDGKKPSMVFQDGYYTRMALAAWDWDGKTLAQRWLFDTYNGDTKLRGQGNHNLSAGDIDGDGLDEIVQGASAIDHDGKSMYSTGLGHGDAMHLSDLDPDNPGLEVWEVHEDTAMAYGHELHDARTGKILWGQNYASDNGRGMAADIDAASPGQEMWSAAGAGIYSSKGKQLSTAKPSINFRVYWDGDLQDELLDGNKLDKWNGNGTTRLITLEGTSCNGTKATPNFSGDLLGDWREEVILHDDANLYLTTTTVPTTHRLYTLAHDPVYRLAMSWQNGAYNQPPHLGFWLGAGVDKAPKPDIRLVGAVSGVGHRPEVATGNGRLSVVRSGTRMVVDLPWNEPTELRVRSLEGRVLAIRAVEGGSRVEWDLDEVVRKGAVLIQATSRSGDHRSAVLAGF